MQWTLTTDSKSRLPDRYLKDTFLSNWEQDKEAIVICIDLDGLLYLGIRLSPGDN